jgi:FkbM family methyltransferase
MEPIHIACQSDSRFAPDCAVMLRSLLSANAQERFVVHFVYGETLAEPDRERLGNIVTSFGSRWAPVGVDDRLSSQFPFMERYGGVTAWFRLLLPRLLEDVRRVLYLDADTMIVRPVGELWQADLGGSCLAAVTQPLLRADRERVVRDLGLPHPRCFFNSGVMLLDLERLRETGLMAEVERYARDRLVPMPWADQEPLNAVLWSERVALHPRWNAMNPCFELPPRYLPWPAEECAEAVRDPAIVHFIGPYKPTHYRLRHPFKATYFEHLHALGWAVPAEQGRTARHVALRAVPPVWALRYEIAEHGVLRRAAPIISRVRRIGPPLRGSRAYGWMRAMHRFMRPGVAPAPLTDLLDAVADSLGEVCFVQIGSNDGDHGDPLRPYVDDRGWRGILVEPVPHVFERLRTKRGGNDRLSLINAAIAASDGQMPFYYVAESHDPALPPWYDQIGSFSRDHVLNPYHVKTIPGLEERIVETEVMCMTFDRLWNEHALPRLDLLHIDAEGFDDVILGQVDLSRLQPLLVLYESKHLLPARASLARGRLEQNGYDVLEIGPDTVAVRSHAPLLVRLAAARQRR